MKFDNNEDIKCLLVLLGNDVTSFALYSYLLTSITHSSTTNVFLGKERTQGSRRSEHKSEECHKWKKFNFKFLLLKLNIK